MNVLFICFNFTQYYFSGMHTSIATLAAVLKSAGHDVKIIEVNNPKVKPDPIIRYAESNNTGLIAFSVMGNTHLLALRLAAGLKAKIKTPIIFGGNPLISIGEGIIKNPNVDYVCIGEGEYPLLELANALDKGKDTTNIMNIIAKKDGALVKNRLRPLNDLNALPFPDVELFHKPYSRIVYQTLSGLGCPYSCSFCHNKFQREYFKSLGPYVRRKSVPRLISELVKVKRKYQLIGIYFCDDLFTLDKKWLSEFSKEFAGKVNVPFTAGARIETIDSEVLSYLKNANCQKLFIGIETGDENIRKHLLDKPISNFEILRKIGLVKKFGIKIQANFIAGLPAKQPDTDIKSYLLARRLRTEIVSTSQLYPHINTQIRKRCEQMRLIPAKDNLVNYQSLEPFLSFDRKTKKAIKKNLIRMQNLNTPLKYPFLIRHPSLQPAYKVLKSLFGEYRIEKTANSVKKFIFKKSIRYLPR